jgi:hypothetical protein
VSFSGDGALLVTAGRDNSVWLWSMEGGGQKFRLRGHSSEVRSAVLTPDGRRVVSAGLDRQILLWDTAGEQELKVLPGQHFSRHDDAILAARFSHDDSQIITASSDRTARIWEVKSRDQIAELKEGHAFLVSGAVLFPDGLTLATAAADNTVRLWDLRSGAQRRTLTDTGRSGVLALSRDAAWLVTGGPEYSARLWAVDAMGVSGSDPPASHRLEGNTGHVTAAACSPVADLVAAGDVNGRIVLSNIVTHETVWNVRPHVQRVNALQFTPDGQGLLIASSDHTMSRVDVSTGRVAAQLSVDGPVTTFDVSDDGSQVVLVQAADAEDAGSKSLVLTWDTVQERPSLRLGPIEATIRSIMMGPDGTAALIACGDNDDNSVRSLSLAVDAQPGPPLVTLEREYGILAAAVLSADGQSLVTMNGSDARLFDAATGREMMAFRPQDALADAEFSPDGTLIITASWDGTVRFWNAAQRPPEAVGTLVAHDQFINSAVFSPDGELILTASDDHTARLWNTKTRERVHELRGHTGSVNQATFSSDGALVLTVSDDLTARLWDATTGQPVGEPFQGGHSRPILCGVFSADGQRIATGSDDNQALIWDVADHRPGAMLSGHTAAVTAIAFSADNARVFTGSRDSTIKVWDVSKQGLQFTSGTAGEEDAGIVRAVDLLTLNGHRREITSLTLSSDGRRILTGSRDQSAIIWNAAEWPLAPQDAPVAALPAATPERR